MGAISQLEDMLADKMAEIAIIQEQLAILSKHHVQETVMVDPYGDTGKYTGQVKNEKVRGGITMENGNECLCSISNRWFVSVVATWQGNHEIRRRPRLCW